MSKPIFLDSPNVGLEEIRSLTAAIDSGFVSSIGPAVTEFEQKFAAYVGTKKAVSTQSGTAALHISLHELGIGPGDEVIVPALTFVASVTPILYVGAKPVFADVDSETWNISSGSIHKMISKKTRAILPVHLYGNPCDMERVMKIARRYKLFVIEDATESLGARVKGKFTGTFGDTGCFSFNGNKVITTGGGGMVVSANRSMVERIHFLVNQARSSRNNAYYHPEMGFNYRMTNLEAALGLAQFKKLKQFILKKKKFHKIYSEELGAHDAITFQKEVKGASSMRWMIAALFRGVAVGTLQEKLGRQNIPTRRIFMPVTEFPFLKKFRSDSLENSRDIFEKGLCLPSSTLNSERAILRVCKAIKRILLKS